MGTARRGTGISDEPLKGMPASRHLSMTQMQARIFLTRAREQESDMDDQDHGYGHGASMGCEAILLIIAGGIGALFFGMDFFSFLEH